MRLDEFVICSIHNSLITINFKLIINEWKNTIVKQNFIGVGFFKYRALNVFQESVSCLRLSSLFLLLSSAARNGFSKRRAVKLQAIILLTKTLCMYDMRRKVSLLAV